MKRMRHGNVSLVLPFHLNSDKCTVMQMHHDNVRLVLPFRRGQREADAVRCTYTWCTAPSRRYDLLVAVVLEMPDLFQNSSWSVVTNVVLSERLSTHFSNNIHMEKQQEMHRVAWRCDTLYTPGKRWCHAASIRSCAYSVF